MKLFNHHIIRIKLAPCPLRCTVLIVAGGGGGWAANEAANHPRGYPRGGWVGGLPPTLTRYLLTTSCTKGVPHVALLVLYPPFSRAVKHISLRLLCPSCLTIAVVIVARLLLPFNPLSNQLWYMARVPFGLPW